MIVHQNIAKGVLLYAHCLGWQCLFPKTNVESYEELYIYIVYDSETKRIDLKEHYDLSRFSADDSFNHYSANVFILKMSSVLPLLHICKCTTDCFCHGSKQYES